MSEGLSEIGVDVGVVTWISQYPRRLYPGPRSADELRFPDQVESTLHWAKPTTWSEVGRKARAADLLVLPWVTPLQALPIHRMIKTANPTPTVLIVHNAMPHERLPLDRFLSTWGMSEAFAAIAHSQAVAEVLGGMVPDLPVTVISHPPNLDLTRTPLPSLPPLRCLFLGAVRPYKGLDIAIDAVALARNEGLDVELTVAGEFWESSKGYKDQIEERDLADHVDLRAGYVPDQHIDHLMSTNHVLLAPYHSASQSGVVPLAHAAGRPVIVTDVGGLRESVNDGVDGYIAPHATAESVAAAIVRAHRSLDELAAGARQKHIATWIDVAEAVVTTAGVSTT